MADTHIPDPTKKERSPAQLEALQKARERAAQVRAKNTDLRRKEREVVNHQLSENRRVREETIQREHAARFQKEQQAKPEPTEDIKDVPTAKDQDQRSVSDLRSPEEPEEEPEVVYQKKPKRKKRIVVVQQESSDDEEEVQVLLPKQKKKPVQEQDANDVMYQKTYQKMFEF